MSTRAYPSRRALLAGLVAAVGSAAFASTAHAMPRSIRRLVDAASRLLRRLGIKVSIPADDTLRVTIQAQEDIRYEQVTNRANLATGQVDQCWNAYSLGPDVEFINFDSLTNNENIALTRLSDAYTVDVLDENMELVVKTPRATYMLREGELILLNFDG